MPVFYVSGTPPHHSSSVPEHERPATMYHDFQLNVSQSFVWTDADPFLSLSRSPIYILMWDNFVPHTALGKSEML